MNLSKLKLDPATGISHQILATPAWRGDPAYDSYLLLKDGSENHTLTLALKLHFNPLALWILPFVVVNDADDTPFLAKPWTQAELTRYKQQVKRTASRWNDKFWLKPPEGFSKLDVKRGGRTIRPNIYCHMYLDIVESPGSAHLSIDLANIDMDSFRSHAWLYSKRDHKDETMHYTDDKGKFRHTRFNTVVHEIGHALGLPHISETHGTVNCKTAIVADDVLQKLFPGSSISGRFGGGSNSQVCYGELGARSHAENVMGMGVRFDASNASPWQARIAQHTGTDMSKWTVSTSRLAPRTI